MTIYKHIGAIEFVVEWLKLGFGEAIKNLFKVENQMSGRRLYVF